MADPLTDLIEIVENVVTDEAWTFERIQAGTSGCALYYAILYDLFPNHRLLRGEIPQVWDGKSWTSLFVERVSASACSIKEDDAAHLFWGEGLETVWSDDVVTREVWINEARRIAASRNL